MNINFTDLDLQVLTNFSNINQTIGFKKGNRQRTISTQKNIIAEYQLENKNMKKISEKHLEKHVKS